MKKETVIVYLLYSTYCTVYLLYCDSLLKLYSVHATTTDTAHTIYIVQCLNSEISLNLATQTVKLFRHWNKNNGRLCSHDTLRKNIIGNINRI